MGNIESAVLPFPTRKGEIRHTTGGASHYGRAILGGESALMSGSTTVGTIPEVLDNIADNMDDAMNYQYRTTASGKRYKVKIEGEPAYRQLNEDKLSDTSSIVENSM